MQNNNRVRDQRVARGWSQAELAENTGMSRTTISAIEGCRMVPSVSSALALAEAFGVSVEDLFASVPTSPAAVWAATPVNSSSPYWHAEVAGRLVRYPARTTPMLTPFADGNASVSARDGISISAANETLVLACCDPAVGLLASLYAQASGMRLLVLSRSSSESLELLRQGLVHMAGLHLATADQPDRNSEVVRERLGSGYRILRLANWEEGIVVSPALKLRSIRTAIRSKLSWVGREPGSGARQCLDRLLNERVTPQRIARHHLGVVEAIQSGWADAGVCVRLPSAEAGLDFVPVQQEYYDVCFAEGFSSDRRAQTFVNVVRSSTYRRMLGGLPGYSSVDTGGLCAIN